MFVVGRLGKEEDDVVEGPTMGFQGSDSFGSDEKAEGGIDKREDWVWIWYSYFSGDLEDIVRVGLLGITF